MSEPTFDAFISYSHKADGSFASKLQEALGRIARPWYRRRALRIFRDETTLSATPELWPMIQRALDQSRYFILLASPEAAASHWVNQEVSYWLSQHRAGGGPASERILIALTDGRVVWSRSAGAKGDFDWNDSDALPVAMKGAFDAEPLYVDFTWASDRSSLSLNHKPWFDNVARLAATIRGIPLDQLIGEDIRQHRITVVSAAGVGLLVLVLGVAIFSTWKTADVLRTEKRHQTDAARVLPQLAGQLEKVRNLPTREIQIEFNPQTFFDDQPEILEVRLELDPLFTQPMSIFFARFAEGRTWPSEFEFEESPYTEFSNGRARVDAKFRWFDRVADLTQTIDGTDAETTPTFNLKFDGQDFLPGGPGIHLRQKFEIPSLQELIDKKVRFRLIEHDPVEKKASEIDLQSRKMDLRVLALHEDLGAVSRLVMFDSHQTELEKAVLAGDYLVNRGPVERTVLLNLYPPISDERIARLNAKRDVVRRLVETRDARTSDDRRLLARALTNSANLSSLRGDDLSALKGYIELFEVLEPLVFESSSKPRRDDGERLFEAALQPVAYFVRAKKFDRAKQYLPKLSLIAERMITSYPEDPDYLRWRAEAFLQKVYVALGAGSQEEAGKALQDYVDSQREVHRRVGNLTTRKELAAALDRADKISSSLPGGVVPIATWRQQASELRQEANRVDKPK